jgi:hypothetical protein
MRSPNGRLEISVREAAGPSRASNSLSHFLRHHALFRHHCLWIDSWPLPQVAKMPCQKVRRSGRITIAVPILLIGSACEGRVFSEETKTVIISLRGAGILSRHKLVSEQELVLRSLESDREVEIRVVGQIGTQADFHAYGVAFVHETLDFWKISLPPPEAPHETVSSLFLNAQVAPHLSYWNMEISNSTSASFTANWSVIGTTVVLLPSGNLLQKLPLPAATTTGSLRARAATRRNLRGCA